ncbi:hypothetical protein NM208_g12434 [Fusarium decemcellulare]|uniref:Uncharacterized protein n=1 Tax=Fusarium decemcellulare TaxID=57161 RepID=A0ACC1RP08_9HYPO|nr:hypothetical protein NM208_g12434 [Fusarium decemcellulare]
MAAMFSQNPLMNGPNYSFSDAPKSNSGEFREHRFNPYTDNGGSTLAISGADFTIMAGDTRHTSGYSINSRMAPKSSRWLASPPTARPSATTSTPSARSTATATASP